MLLHDPLLGTHPPAPAPGRQRRPPSLATFRRRRAVAAAVFVVALLATGAGVLAVLGSGDVPASAAGTQHLSSRSTVVAAPGDSLWTIAESTYDEVADGSMSFQRYVDLLVELNGGASIDAGQHVRLP